MEKITIRLSKVKNRNRCWVATYRTPFMKMLDVRDINKDKLVFHFDEMENQMVVRLASEMESKGANINNPMESGIFRSSLVIDNDFDESDYAISENYEEQGFTWYVLKAI